MTRTDQCVGPRADSAPVRTTQYKHNDGACLSSNNISWDREDHLLAGNYSLEWARLNGRENAYFAASAEDDVLEATSLPNAVWNQHQDGEWFELPTDEGGIHQPQSVRVALMEHLEGLLDCEGRVGGKGPSVGRVREGVELGDEGEDG